MDANILIKALTDQVKQYSEIQSERSKIKGELFINAIKAKENFFFKQQTRAAEQQEERQAQQNIQSRIGAIQARQAPDPDVSIQPFRETPTSRVGLGREGRQEITKPLSRKEFVYKRIQDKKNMRDLLEEKGDPRAKNFELSEAEKRYEADYLGVEEKVKAPSRKITGIIRKLKAVNASREDIEEAIRFEGYEIEDYSQELEEYQSFRDRGASERW